MMIINVCYRRGRGSEDVLVAVRLQDELCAILSHKKQVLRTEGFLIKHTHTVELRKQGKRGTEIIMSSQTCIKISMVLKWQTNKLQHTTFVGLWTKWGNIEMLSLKDL